MYKEHSGSGADSWDQYSDSFIPSIIILYMAARLRHNIKTTFMNPIAFRPAATLPSCQI